MCVKLDIFARLLTVASYSVGWCSSLPPSLSRMRARMRGGRACPRPQALSWFLPQYGILTECPLAVPWLVYGISLLVMALAPKTNRFLFLRQASMAHVIGQTPWSRSRCSFKEALPVSPVAHKGICLGWGGTQSHSTCLNVCKALGSILSSKFPLPLREFGFYITSIKHLVNQNQL